MPQAPARGEAPYIYPCPVPPTCQDALPLSELILLPGLFCWLVTTALATHLRVPILLFDKPYAPHTPPTLGPDHDHPAHARGWGRVVGGWGCGWGCGVGGRWLAWHGRGRVRALTLLRGVLGVSTLALYYASIQHLDLKDAVTLFFCRWGAGGGVRG